VIFLISISENEFSQFSSFIKGNYGINLKEEKKALLTSRLYKVLEQEGFKNYTDYFNHIVNDRSGSAVNVLLNKITTNHTYFMREADHFYFFRDKVLPFLTESVKYRDLRIWCAACSTGEESYTIAMLLDEFFGKNKPFWDTKVLATDISDKVLEIAKEGKYRNESVSALPANWRSNYFRKFDEEFYVVTDKIKNEVIYRKLNLMDPKFPFKQKLHTVFLRNVMIYFDNETKFDLVNKIYDNMEYGGYLFIGHSESLGREGLKFKYVMPSVYVKQ
jgi:chemotaxis protein methyltransferase CheR